VSALTEADAFKLPDMTDGTAYLYNSVYRRLARGEDVRLSGINFDAFEPEDVESLEGLYSDIFEKNNYVGDDIISTLQKVAPVCKAVGFV
jgi:hypothetical protein